jgi:hypothetical protein
MRKRFPKLVLIAVVAMGLGLTAGLMPAQQPPAAQQAADANGNGMEVLSRGPVHEAYADTHAVSASTPNVTKMPPDGIEEMPPDHKPDGNNVQWIPGYWHWDEDRQDFSWISGFWRAVPPGRVWVPGSWRGVPGAAQSSWQWVPGVWQEAPAQQALQGQQQAVQHEVQYLAEPPATIEAGPTTPQPTVTSFYSPGGWVWRGNRYVWVPGYWMEHRTGWVWVPPHYRWSPIGYIYVEGYWDYPLQTRGVLYSPVAYTNAVYLQPGYVYTPTYVVSDQCMMGAMFVRRGWGCYYFGDYYGAGYVAGGYSAWCGAPGANGVFVVGYGVGPRWGYDPLWSYYSVAYRESPGWRDGMGTLYVGRFNGTIAAPPVTLVQQNVYINRVTNVTVVNVTNSYTVVKGSITVNNVNVSGMAMVAPTRIVTEMHPEMRIQPLPMAARRQEMAAARQMREAAAVRMRAENAVVARGGGIPKPGQAPHTAKVEVPHAAVARAQIDERKAPPPNPHKTAAAVDHANTGKIEPKVDHTATTKIDPKGPNTPKVDPKIDPKGPNAPKIDPKGPTTPNKNEPKRDQKNEKP